MIQARFLFRFCVSLVALLGFTAVVSHQVCGQDVESTTARQIDLKTVAEKSDFKSTATYEEVMAFCKALAEQSPRVHLTDFGSSFEGRKLPLLIVSDPPMNDTKALRDSGKLPVFVMANIHAGEVCGKEATLMLARELAGGSNDPLLQRIVLLIAPIYNADGNERFAKNNRRGQVGPENGMGQRHNMQDLDLNRDHLKLESPEARALAKLITDWNPAILIDTHTTNGSHHRYTITYDSPRHPATPGNITEYVRDRFLPEVSRQMEQKSGYRSFYYGNFDKAHQQWISYPDGPRYSTHYFGMRGRIGILSEAYAYASYRDRVLATKQFVESCLEVAHDAEDAIWELLKEAKEDVPEFASDKKDASTMVAIRSEMVPLDRPFDVLGYVEKQDDAGKWIATDNEKTYQNVRYVGLSKPTLSVAAPYAYVIPAEWENVIENLSAHGVSIKRIRSQLQLDARQYRVTKIKRAKRKYQGHHHVSLEVKPEDTTCDISAGDVLVKVAQPLGALVVNLLEPHSQDGLVTWNFFDGHSDEKGLEEGRLFPVVRLERETPILVVAWESASATETLERITPEVWYGKNRPNLDGHPASGFRWLDGESYLVRGSDLWHQVDARTGSAKPFAEPDRIRKALASQPAISRRQAGALMSQISRRLSEDCKSALISHDSDLYTVDIPAAKITRITNTPGAEEVASSSPDGQWVAFVRDNNLFSRNLTDGREYQLTVDGNRVGRYGKADWVYFEEVYDRSWKGYKFSPDSRQIALMHYDDSPVRDFHVIDHMTPRTEVATERYPKAGDPIPRVRLGVVSTAGGRVQWMDLSRYSPDNMIVTRFGWLPDSRRLYLLVQDRAQRWMDFNQADVQTGNVTRSVRQRSEHWVPDPGPLHYLEDGSYLVRRDEDGWRHLYRISPSSNGGKQQITKGPWEVRDILDVDEEGGWVYFLGTRDSHLAENLYRVNLGSPAHELQRLTLQDGRHRINLSPDRKLFIDASSTLQKPTRVTMREVDTPWQRLLDDNPIPDLTKYALSDVELHEVALSDGYRMPLTITKPSDFAAGKKYPVWIMTYGGPHAPTVSDSWSGRRRGYDQMLNEMGIIAVHCDPRSASGQGPQSTWTAYRQLGVQETRDLEGAVDWLVDQGYVDADHIGLSGHSYGGYLTAYALTHSKKFAAGIAGAPVTDWRNYDAFYTERYMDTPQENPDGYDASSVLTAAKDLHGRLLLLHGAKDDNVHLQNTLQLAQKLQQADKQFEMMIYPTNRHGIYGDHYNRVRLNFIRQAMFGGGADHRGAERTDGQNDQDLE